MAAALRRRRRGRARRSRRAVREDSESPRAPSLTRRRPRRPSRSESRAIATVEVDVVHEDADVLVVDKPAGLVVHPGAGNTAGTLVHGLLARFPEIADVGDPARPGIVHRLDKGTSGLLVVARSPAAYDVARGAALVPLGRAAVRRARVGPTRARDRCHRRARRSFRPRPDADDGQHTRSSGAHALPGRRRCTATPRSSACSNAGSRPVARTRSASTSPRSTIRSSATAATAGSDEPLHAPRPMLHARALGLRAPDDR